MREFYDANMNLLDIKVGDCVICYGSIHHPEIFKPGEIYKIEKISDHLVVRHHTSGDFYTGLSAQWGRAPTKFKENITDWL